MKKLKQLLYLTLLIASANLFAQVGKQNVRKNFFNIGVDSAMSKKIGQYGFTTMPIIDVKTNADGYTYDEKKLLEDLEKQFPDPNDSRYLTLDWEDHPFDVLYQNRNTATPLGTVVQQYIKLFKLVKSKRPNLKVGFYGLPIKEYWKRDQSWRSHNNNLDPILKIVDVIYPTVYIPYKEGVEAKAEDILNFLKDNIESALMYGVKYNKPVYPYIWQRYHIANKTVALMPIPYSVFNKQMKVIYNTSYKGKKIDGTILWSAEFYYFLQTQSKNVPDISIYRFNDQNEIWRYLNIIKKYK